mgnify:CR=1 FL=1
MIEIKDIPSRDLWKALRDPGLRENVRRELSEQTGFQQGLAVDAITRSFFMHTTQDIGCPNIITLIAKDEQHVEKFCRSFQKVIGLHLGESPVFIDASKQQHQDCIPANGFAFVFIRNARDLLNEGLFEFNKWKGGDRLPPPD